MAGDSSAESADGAAALYALVPKEQAESTRRALDAEGLLDTTRKAHVHSGQLALPLAASAASSSAPQLAWSGGVLPTALLVPPTKARGERASLRDAVQRALLAEAAPAEHAALLLRDAALPKRWEKLGDVLLFAPRGMLDSSTAAGAALHALSPVQRAALWAALASALGARRLGVQGVIEESLHRKSTARLLWPEEGASGWTVQRENGVSYGIDVTRNMFSSGNVTEKARVGRFRCQGQTVVDLYAGIGYFTLPYLVCAGAEHVHACEWDEDALEALRRNLEANGVAGRCTVHPGDNAGSASALRGVAHRVNLGLIPSSEQGWPLAVGALRAEGGTLHVHANVGSAAEAEAEWVSRLCSSLGELAARDGRAGWVAQLLHLERVKSYAPKVNHVVADVRLGVGPSGRA